LTSEEKTARHTKKGSHQHIRTKPKRSKANYFHDDRSNVRL